MLRILRRSILAGFLIISLSINAAVIVSEFAYNVLYGLVSNALSIVYEGSELTSSIGWKKQQFSKQLKVLDGQLIDTKNKFSILQSEMAQLLNEKKVLSENLSALNKTILAKESEISNLRTSTEKLSKEIRTKTDELKNLKVQLNNLNQKKSLADVEIKKLRQTNIKISSQFDQAQGTISGLKTNLTESKFVNAELSNLMAKNGNEIARLTKVTSEQLLDIQNTRKIIRTTTDGVTKRIGTRVARNLGAMPFESIPVAGIAITVGTIYLELRDACESLKDFDEMKATLGFEDPNPPKSFCSLTKEDLSRIISDKKNELEQCQAEVSNSSDVSLVDLVNCLPQEIEVPEISMEDDLEMPLEAEL